MTIDLEAIRKRAAGWKITSLTAHIDGPNAVTDRQELLAAYDALASENERVRAQNIQLREYINAKSAESSKPSRCICHEDDGDFRVDCPTHGFYRASACPRCGGTGMIDAPTSADDPSCPECDGEGAASDQPRDVVCKCDDHDARYCVNRISKATPCKCECHRRGASVTDAHSGEDATTGTPPTLPTSTDKSSGLDASDAGKS